MLTPRRKASRSLWPGAKAGPAARAPSCRPGPQLRTFWDRWLQPRPGHHIQDLDDQLWFDGLPACILQLDRLALDQAVTSNHAEVVMFRRRFASRPQNPQSPPPARRWRNSVSWNLASRISDPPVAMQKWSSSLPFGLAWIINSMTAFLWDRGAAVSNLSSWKMDHSVGNSITVKKSAKHFQCVSLLAAPVRLTIQICSSRILDVLGYRLTILRPCGQVDKQYGEVVWSPFPNLRAQRIRPVALWLGLATEFCSEKIPRNRLGTASVIPRKKVLIPTERKEMAWKKLVLHKILLQQTELTACFRPRHASERNSELLSLPRNGSEQNSKCLLTLLFPGTEFRVVFSSAE